MGLTSRSFVELTIAAAVCGLAGTVWLWPRVASQRIAPIAVRLGLIAASQALAVIALLAAVNGYFMFYGSWSALLGGAVAQSAATAGTAASPRPITITATDLGPVPGSGSVLPESANGKLAAKPPHYYAKHHTVAKHAVVGGPSPKGGLSRAARSAGELLQVTISGEHTGITSGRNFVYLPPQYFQPAYARARFPVVLALTGYPNEAWSLVKFLALPATAAGLVAGGKIRPAVYVMMNSSVALPRDTECTDIPAGLQVESFFAQDVPLAMERTFRVQPSGSGWAVLGYSAGFDPGRLDPRGGSLPGNAGFPAADSPANARLLDGAGTGRAQLLHLAPRTATGPGVAKPAAGSCPAARRAGPGGCSRPARRPQPGGGRDGRLPDGGSGGQVEKVDPVRGNADPHAVTGSGLVGSGEDRGHRRAGPPGREDFLLLLGAALDGGAGHRAVHKGRLAQRLDQIDLKVSRW